jgi:dienelactone hydrolase
VSKDGVQRSLIRYPVGDGEQVEALLFQPASGHSQGAMLALHQHNSQWTIGKSEIAGLAGDPLQAFGPALARRGVTVLVPDAIGFESRRRRAGWGTPLAPPLDRPHSTAEDWVQYYNEMAFRIVRGELLMTKMLADCASALTVLGRYSDATQAGVLGHSFGGIITLFLAALDTRVTYACCSGALCSYRQKFACGTALEMSLIIPGFQNSFDFDDLLRCVAPRKMLIVSAEGDPQSADAEDVVGRARPAFDSNGCPYQLQHVRVPGSHALNQYRFDLIVNWMAAQAKVPDAQPDGSQPIDTPH